MSRARIERWVQSWCTRAGQILKVLDGACKKLVVAMCIDELFFRRQPVLVGVEPHSMASGKNIALPVEIAKYIISEDCVL